MFNHQQLLCQQPLHLNNHHYQDQEWVLPMTLLTETPYNVIKFSAME